MNYTNSDFKQIADDRNVDVDLLTQIANDAYDKGCYDRIAEDERRCLLENQTEACYFWREVYLETVKQNLYAAAKDHADAALVAFRAAFPITKTPQ